MQRGWSDGSRRHTLAVMTVAQLLADESFRQSQFPVCAKKIFLGHAGVCPLPRRVVDAMAAYGEQCTLGDQEDALAPGFESRTRAVAAGLIGAQPEEIALVGPTSLALSFVAGGLPWRRGDNVLVYLDDYPANVYPWMALGERGVQVRFLNVRQPGYIRLVDVQGQVDENTRLVALSSCHFSTGWRLNVPALGRWLRSRNILFCLDAIQTLGAFPVRAVDVDFLAADAHKWLLGPCGAGILFVKKELQERLRPMVYGWHNLRCPNFQTQTEMVFKPDARRYEAGTNGFLGLHGLCAAMELIQELTPEAIEFELLRKRSWMVPALEAKGYAVLHSTAPPENAGAFFSFFRPGSDMPALHQRLMEAGVVTSLRSLPDTTKVIRVAPHVYNTDAELHRLLELL